MCTTILCHSISIHALRVEGDVFELIPRIGFDSISIHALRVEGDLIQHLSAKTIVY